MKIQILERKDKEIKFLLEGVTPSFANELRRIVMVEVPTMAIEWVDFKKNDSVLNDEIIANRLGQIPLTFDKKAYNLHTGCKCEGKGCSRCQIKMVLKKKGPSMVYSGDLKSRAKDVQPVFEKIPVVELFEDENLEFEATAQLGLGKENIKWQGGIVGYKPKLVKEVPKKDENEETKYLEDTFIFSVESVSGYSPEELVLTAAGLLEDKMNEFDKNLKKLK
jgi:DNA-directed RNA polymerase alpha subunit